MPKHPPHLPPQSCSIKFREKVRLIPKVLFIVLISALTGLSISLTTVAWFLPNISSGYLIKVNNHSDNTLTSADPALVKLTKQRLIYFYDNTKEATAKVYRESAMVGTGAVLSSDGWVVVSNLNLPVNRKQIVGMDSRGEIFEVEKAVEDKIAGVVFLKIKTDGLRVMPFVNWNDVGENFALWSIKGNDWRGTEIDRLVEKTTDSGEFAIWNPPYSFALGTEVDKGNLLLNSSGEMVGFVDKDNNVVPSWLINEQLANVLTDNSLAYFGLPYTGYFVQGAGGDGNAAFLGFYISKSLTRPTATTIGIGDIIIKLNGETLNHANFARQNLVGTDDVLITFLREGKENEVRVKKGLVE